MAGFLIVNPRSGDGSPDAEEVERAARDIGVGCRVLARGDDPAELARAADADALGVAGGDGSLAAVAAVALERDLPFVCIPFGTRNHFARDLGLDRDEPLAALRAFGGEERRIDVGRVNERLFLNNVSLGAYADLVHRRERRRRRREALAGARALVRGLGRRRRLHARVDGKPLAARIVLIGNNAYQLSLLTLGERASLDEGVLALYTADGWLPRHWTEQRGERFEIDFSQPRAGVAVDGEPVTLETPLRLESLPRALRVLVPPE